MLHCADYFRIVPQPILITGATGFIGRWMLETAKRKTCGYAMARTWPWDLSPWPYMGYEKEVQHVDELERDHDPDCVMPRGIIHLAGYDGGRAHETTDGIVNGAISVSRLAVRHKCRVLNVSSGAAALHDTAYGHAKRLSELIFNDAGIDVVHARVYAVIGPGMNLDRFAIGNFIRDGMAGGKVCVSGDGTALRGWAYITDVCESLWYLLAKGKKGEVYDVGSSDAHTIREAARLAAKLTGSEVKVLGDQRPEYCRDYVPAVGTPCRVRWDEGIRRTVEWFEGKAVGVV